MIQEFDDEQVHDIWGAKKSDNGEILYFLKYKDGKASRSVPSSEAVAKWPNKVLKHLETIAHMAAVRAVNFSTNVTESADPGAPIRASCKLNIFKLSKKKLFD